MSTLLRGIAAGAAAGAAGTTALEAATYLDMALRGRPASSTPEQTVERLAGIAGIDIPGTGDARANRLAGLGPLLGAVAGIAAGAALGAVRGLGWRAGAAATVGAASLAGLLVGNVPMTVVGITDPRQWSAEDWLADVVPHVAYGAVTGAVLVGLDR